MKQNIDNINFETLSSEQVLSVPETDKEKGLSEEEAKKRLEVYGENKLEEKAKKTWIQIFLEQLNNPMIFVLFGAILVTIAVSIYDTIVYIKEGNAFNFLEAGDWPDVIIILMVILLNATIGTVQEVKAQTSLEALKKLSSPESTVIRSGKRFKVKSSELVIGDIVVIEEGDTIGADLRLLESYNLKANESSLTGESTQVEKFAETTFSEPVGIGDRVNMVYMTTPVTYGRAIGVVSGTGMNTEIGKIAASIDEGEDEETPLQKALGQLSKILGFITLMVVVIVLIADLIWIFVDGKGMEIEAYIEALLSSISLAVAAIPEGLSAVVTIVLSIGVQKMVKANTVVRKLPSVETLGAVSVVCSDKTGTLTQNKMTVVEAYSNFKTFKRDEFSSNKYDLESLATGMSLCSNATVDEGLYGDPTEIALVVFANELDLTKKQLENKYPRVEELPFDSVRKMMSTRHEFDGKTITYTKGALDSIMSRVTKVLVNGEVRNITQEDINIIYDANKDFSSRALRVLALAYQENGNLKEEDLVFVGLTAMLDPARPEARPAVLKFKEAGITTVMITGDHRDTAFAIAKELCIVENPDQVMEGKEVDELTFEELQEVCKKVRVFARVSPENKVQIVKAFKANGNICAMTGDGVNDAPSLKAADIGIAMGITGTDVAKSTADMVLTDDNFASIEKAVEEGRTIFADIKKTVLFLLSSNIAEVISMFIIICMGLPAPLIAIHLLWVNLITDSLPAIALGMDPKESDVMKDKPRDPNKGLLANGGSTLVGGYGLVISLCVLASYFICGGIYCAQAGLPITLANIKIEFVNEPASLLHAQTMAFTTLAFSELFHMLGMSNTNKSFISIFKKKNVMIYIAFAAGILLQLLVVEVGFISKIFSTSNLTTIEWLITLGLSIVPLLVHEIVVLVKWIILKGKK